MSLIRYEPWETARQLHREIDRLFRSGGDERDSLSDWRPAVDIREEQDRYVLHADVPGIDPKDIDIAMEDGILTLSGERAATTTDEGEGYRRVERVTGKFFRRFSLPDGVDPESVSARSELGVLEVTIPKLAQAQRKRIDVAVS